MLFMPVLPVVKMPLLMIRFAPFELPEMFRIVFPVAKRVGKKVGPFRIPYMA